MLVEIPLARSHTPTPAVTGAEAIAATNRRPGHGHTVRPPPSISSTRLNTRAAALRQMAWTRLLLAGGAEASPRRSRGPDTPAQERNRACRRRRTPPRSGAWIRSIACVSSETPPAAASRESGRDRLAAAFGPKPATLQSRRCGRPAAAALTTGAGRNRSSGDWRCLLAACGRNRSSANGWGSRPTSANAC
jgi:hypothetical protein